MDDRKQPDLNYTQKSTVVTHGEQVKFRSTVGPTGTFHHLRSELNSVDAFFLVILVYSYVFHQECGT